jgi:formylglycine-generating enzyme required for sulfatase activity
VGCFPGGASLYVAEDLSGNVWEWCRTQWENDYEGYRNDNDLEGSSLRVLRGGSFSCTEDGVRCACRGGNNPDLLWVSYGFRVVVAPFSPTSDL